MLPNLRSGIAQLLRRKPIQIGSGRNMCTSSKNTYDAERTEVRVFEWIIRRGSPAFLAYMMTWAVCGDLAFKFNRQCLEFFEEQEKDLEEREKRLERRSKLR